MAGAEPMRAVACPGAPAAIALSRSGVPADGRRVETRSSIGAAGIRGSDPSAGLAALDWVRAPLWIAAIQVVFLSIALPAAGGFGLLAANGVLVLATLALALRTSNSQGPLFRASIHVGYLASFAGIAYSVFHLGMTGSLTVYYAPAILVGAANLLGARAAILWAIPSVALIAASEWLPRPARLDPEPWIGFVVGAGVLVTVLAFAISLRRAYDRQAARLAELATTDGLTGLANRLELDLALRQAIHRAHRFERHGALVFIDLDGMKRINDEFGHDLGDEVLRETAARLRALTREIDTAARLGGDEFVVLLSEFDDPKGAEIFARKLLARLGEPHEIRGRSVRVGASIGIADFHGPQRTAREVLRAADQAMYAAKSAGGGAIHRESPEGTVPIR